MRDTTLTPSVALVHLGLLLAAALTGWLVARVVGAATRRWVPASSAAGHMLASLDVSARRLLPIGAMLPFASVAPPVRAFAILHHALLVLFVLGLTWASMRLVRAVSGWVAHRHPTDVADNLEARRIRTQTDLLARSLNTLIAILGLAAVLMTFPAARQLGASLLASAGIAGLVVGFAARPVLANLIAGMQIALTQPIRLDDVVIVENEWGRIEEIGGTYVVIRIWDDRRLVVPLNYFLEHPFENWTRRSTNLLGTVFLWLDYATPFDVLRGELERICRASPRWDGRVCLLQVTDASERAVQVRALVSAANSGLAFDLRCEVREALIRFLQDRHPQALPRARQEMVDGSEPITPPAVN